MITWKDNEAFLGDKNLGRLGENYFISNRNTSDHYFRKFKGWGFNKELIADLIRKGTDQFRLDVDNGRRLLVTSPAGIVAFGKNWDNTLEDGTKEPQWILNEEHFNKKYEKGAEGELMRYE